MILARTLKGKGLAAIEGKDGLARQGAQEGQGDRRRDRGAREAVRRRCAEARRSSSRRPRTGRLRRSTTRSCRRPHYKLGDLVATREAWGAALAAVGGVDERIVALDADVKNSTFSDKFEKAHPDRFFEDFIAEQVMVGAAMGLAARGAVPFPSTFACFLTRAADFIRMAGISFVQRQARRLARRHLDRRGRPVADGARGSRR